VIEIIQGVHAVGGPDITGPNDAFSYLVDIGTELVLIDTGASSDASAIMNNIREACRRPVRLTHVILTHNHIDHIAGAADIRRQTSAKISIHELDAEAVITADPERTAASWYGTALQPLRVDTALQGPGEPFNFGNGSLSWIHTPGHTPGSISVIFEKDGKTILFGQDIHGPFMPQFNSDVDQWRASMHRLLLLKPDILCEGHYGIFKPADRATAFIEDFLNRL